jgi:hypothetical protein
MTRWDLANGVCLCVLHHVFGKFSAHKAPIEFAEWLKERRSEEWYSTLRRKASGVYLKPDLLIIRDNLKAEIEKFSHHSPFDYCFNGSIGLSSFDSDF